MTDRFGFRKCLSRTDIFTIMFILTMMVFFCSCRQQPDTTAAPVEKPPILVRTIVVPQALGQETKTFPIFAKESQTAKLSFRVPGQLLEFNPELGAPVAKDEVVARLDPRDYQLAVTRLDQGILEAEALLAAMRTGARAEDIAALESQLAGADTAVFNAKKQLDRMTNLRKDGTASEVQFDLAQTAHETAVAHQKTLKTQLEKAKAGARVEEIEAMEAKIAGLHVDRSLAENKLADTQLKAPFNGRIARKFFDNHETVAPGIAVLEVVDSDAMEATLSVPEEIVLRKDQIQKVECRFDSLPGVLFAGTVKEIGRSVQQGNLAYPMTIRVDVSQTEKSEGGKADGSGSDDRVTVLPGMVGTATLILSGGERSFLIPSAALIPDAESKDGSAAVWGVDPTDQTLRRHPVRIASFTEEGAVVESGLSPGEVIVGAGARFLEEGRKVRTE